MAKLMSLFYLKPPFETTSERPAGVMPTGKGTRIMLYTTKLMHTNDGSRTDSPFPVIAVMVPAKGRCTRRSFMKGESCVKWPYSP